MLRSSMAFGCAAVLMTAALAAGQATQPVTQVPVLPEKTLKYAPAGAIAMVHVDLDVPKLFEGINKIATAEEANTVFPAIRKAVAGVTAAELFLSLPNGEPSVLVVVYGKVAIDDVNAMLRVAAEGLDAKFTPAGNGRHVLKITRQGEPMQIIIGGEANDVPAGVSLLGAESILDANYVAALGKTPNAMLTGLLAKVDTTASAWFATDLTALPFGGPTSACGWLAMYAKGNSRIVANFIDADTASEFMKDYAEKVEESTKEFAKLTLDGKTISLASNSDEPILPRVINALAEARKMARRAAAKANISSIGKAIAMYQSGHEEKAPDSFMDLVKDGQSPAIFVSPTSGKKPSADALKTGKLDTDYIYLKYKNLSAADSALIVAYENPEINGGEGTNVLCTDTHVEWLKMDEFKARLEKSKKYIAEEK